jgi:hypothetical protein
LALRKGVRNLFAHGEERCQEPFRPRPSSVMPHSASRSEKASMKAWSSLSCSLCATASDCRCALGFEGRRADVRHPGLNRGQALPAQPFTVRSDLVPRGSGRGCHRRNLQTAGVTDRSTTGIIHRSLRVASHSTGGAQECYRSDASGDRGCRSVDCAAKLAGRGRKRGVAGKTGGRAIGWQKQRRAQRSSGVRVTQECASASFYLPDMRHPVMASSKRCVGVATLMRQM